MRERHEGVGVSVSHDVSHVHCGPRVGGFAGESVGVGVHA